MSHRLGIVFLLVLTIVLVAIGIAPANVAGATSSAGLTNQYISVASPTSPQAAIAAGNNHTCALTTGGGVKCWGDNEYGQLGDGTTINRLTPVDVSGLISGVSAIAAGDSHTCALTTAGGVKCWGYNYYGQLGDGTTTARLTPVDVSGLAGGVSAIAAGYAHTCAVTAAGEVKCWGNNYYGQLGDGTTTARLTPVAINGLAGGVNAIAAGWAHTCAVTAAGGVKCWGENWGGQLGDGTTTNRLTPVAVSGLASGVSAIAAGDSHTCSLTTAGAAKCWGSGVLGDGTSTGSLTPVDVSGLTGGVSAIAAGEGHTCVLIAAGGVKCWGSNGRGQLGDDTTTDRLTPVDVFGLTSGVSAITVGDYHTCALLTAGVKCWGYNGNGELGNGNEIYRPIPVNVSGLHSGVSAITAGGTYSCALTTAGGVKCWGDNWQSQLGDGTTTGRLTPVAVSGLASGVGAIAAGDAHSCALTTTGGVKCWGYNGDGELGDGTTTWRLTPVDVFGLAGGVSTIAAGGSHSCALTTAGGVKCWGSNWRGQLGDGTGGYPYAGSNTPVNVSGLSSGVSAIATGYDHTCALTTVGGVKCWGDNSSGELGDGTTIRRLTPTDVSGLTSGVISIATGGAHTCALTTTGGVKCWGYNEDGELGDGTTTGRLTPVDVFGLASGVNAIAAGGSHTCALATAGGVKCWGSNWRGQLGDGTMTDRLTPVPVFGLASGVIAHAAGGIHSCVKSTAGGVKCWGYNDHGQLGDGTGAYHLTPVDVVGFGGIAVLPDYIVEHIEVTQSIQDLNNSVPLIAGKKTYARVHVRNIGDASNAWITARLCRGTDCRTPDNRVNGGPPGFIQISNNPDRGAMDDSFYFLIDKSWVSSPGQLVLSATVNDRLFTAESDTSNNSYTLTGESIPELVASFPLNVRLFNVKYKTSSPLSPVFKIPESRQDLDYIRSWLERAYPVSVEDLHVEHDSLRLDHINLGDLINPGDNLYLEHLAQLRISLYLAVQLELDRRLGNDFAQQAIYYGAIIDGDYETMTNGFFVRGVGGLNNDVALGPTGTPSIFGGTGPIFSWDLDNYYGDWYAGHEIGHILIDFGNQDKDHVDSSDSGCDYVDGPNTAYPYLNGIIGGRADENPQRFYGFDTNYPIGMKGVRVYPFDWHDMMTYCPNQWISDYHYSAIYDTLQERAENSSMLAANASALSSDYQLLLVSAIVNLTENTAEFQSGYRFTSSSPAQLASASEFSIQLRDELGNPLATYPVLVGSDSDTEPGEDEYGQLVETVPWVDGSHEIVLMHNGFTLATQAVSTSTPQVSLVYPNGGEIVTNTLEISWTASDGDGDELTYAIQYSDDNGVSWSTLQTGITDTSIEFDASQLSGSTAALVRVLATDGVNTGSDQSNEPFQVAGKSAEPIIDSPATGSVFVQGQTIGLFGNAYDVEDGYLKDSAISWNSDLSGSLGTGTSVYLDNMALGTHQITMTATDSAGNQSTDTIAITIEPAPEPPEFPAQPDPTNEATNTPINVTLSWTGSDPNLGDTLTYDVFFGTTNPPPQVVAGQIAATYDPPGDLVYSTTYYWQISAMDDTGLLTEGPVWSFTTIDSPHHSITLNPIADAYTSSAAPTTNYGNATTLRVKEASADMYSFLKFDTSALSCVQVVSATLRLYVTDAGPNAGSVYSSGSDWAEGTLNWNNDPTISGSPLDSPGAAALNTWVEFDITSGLSPGGESSFGLKGNVSDIVYYSSRESARDPELVITYTELPGAAPTADFSADPLSGNAPLAVTFTNASSGCPTSYLWDFGDGGTSTGANPVHTYTAPGTYEVSLTAGNAHGDDTETRTGYITVSPPPPEPDLFISPSGSATIGGIPSTPADILLYEKDNTVTPWTMVYDGSVRGTAKNVTAFHMMEDGSVLLVFAANQVIAGLGTATPYDVVRFIPGNPGVYPMAAGTYEWFFQGKPQGLTTTAEKIDAIDLDGDRLLLSTTGAAKVPLLPSGTLSAADEDVFAFNRATNRWENTLVIDGSKMPGMGVEDISGIWNDPDSGDYYITITGAFNLGGVKGNGKSIVKLTPNGGATVFTPSLVPWLAPGVTFPSNLDEIDLIR